MTTILPKEPAITERKSVILSDAERRNLRRKLRGSVQVAQKALNPKTQIGRLISKGAAEARNVGQDVTEVVKENATVVGALGLGSLVFLARGPIFRLYARIRNRKTVPEGTKIRKKA